MNTKTYTIDNIKFTLKTDLTLDESEEVSRLLSDMHAPDKNTVAGNFTSAQIKRFLEIVLEAHSHPSPGEGSQEKFDFGKIKESVQLEVFKDFFLERLAKMTSTANVFAESIKQQ